MLGIALQVKDQAVRFGPGRAARYFAWRVADRLVGYLPYQGFVLRTSRTRAHATPAPNGFVCREVPLDELARYTGDCAYDLTERFLSEAKVRNDCCIGVFTGVKLVSYSFNSRMPVNIDPWFRYEFAEGWIYHFKAFTLREWRGHGLHGRQMPAIQQKFSAVPGFKGLTSLVVSTNYALLHSFRRLYFEPVFRFVIAGKGAKRRLVRDTLGRVSEADGKLIFRPHGVNETFAVAKLEHT